MIRESVRLCPVLLNGEKILEDAFSGLGELTGGPLLNPHPACNKNLALFKFDLKKAEELLAEAGWKDIDNDGILEREINGEVKKFEFVLLIPGRNSGWAGAADIYKEDLINLGVKMYIQAP